MLGTLLHRFTAWALHKNGPGGYAGEDDKRWAYTIETDGDEYLTRVLLSRVVPWLRDRLNIGVYLHHFIRPDQDRNLHSHPWSWALSIVLSGGYDEVRLEEVVPYACDRSGCEVMHRPQILTETRRVRWFNFLTKDDYHAVKKLHGDVWTLFITGPRMQDWGFLVDGEHVPWRKYLGKEK